LNCCVKIVYGVDGVEQNVKFIVRENIYR